MINKGNRGVRTNSFVEMILPNESDGEMKRILEIERIENWCTIGL